MIVEPSVFPSTLPGPSRVSLAASERRLTSDLDGGPQSARGIQRDYLALETVEWNLLDATAAAGLQSFWDSFLAAGALWFRSTWASPLGFVAFDRRFVEPPKWTHLAGGFWSVSATFQVRGAGTAPMAYRSDCSLAVDGATLSFSEPGKINAGWRTGNPSAPVLAALQPVLGTYNNVGVDPGDIGDNYFPAHYTVAWADLLAPPGVSVFGHTRNGNYPSLTDATITVTGVPTDIRLPECRACALITYGGWLGAAGAQEGIALPIYLAGVGLIAHAKFFADGGAGNSLAVFLIRNNRGVLSGIDVAHP
ncbi:MAG: hypothetical protein QM702_00215 [Rubrivivax sp.]